MAGDTNYQVPIYLKQGGAELRVMTGGSIVGDSGGTLYADDGFTFYFNQTAITANQMKLMLSNKLLISEIGTPAVSTNFSVVNVPSDVGMVIYSMTSTCLSGVVHLTSLALVGREILIKIRSGSCESGVIYFSTSGCSIINERGSALSGFELRNSTNSAGWVRLFCKQVGEWAVIDRHPLGYAE